MTTNAQAALAAATRITAPGEYQALSRAKDRAEQFKTWLDAQDAKDREANRPARRLTALDLVDGVDR